MTYTDLIDALTKELPSQTLLEWHSSGKLAEILPEVDVLFGIPQPEAHHPEIDTGVHVCMVADYAWAQFKDPAILFAAVCHDLGKGITPQELWPKHHSHEELGLPLVEQVNQRFDVSPEVARLNELVCVGHLRVHRCMDSRPGSIIQWLEKEQLLEDEPLLLKVLDACEADARGRKNLETRPYPQKTFLQQLWHLNPPVESTREVWLSSYIHRAKLLHAEMKDPEDELSYK